MTKNELINAACFSASFIFMNFFRLEKFEEIKKFLFLKILLFIL